MEGFQCARPEAEECCNLTSEFRPEMEKHSDVKPESGSFNDEDTSDALLPFGREVVSLLTAEGTIGLAPPETCGEIMLKIAEG